MSISPWSRTLLLCAVVAALVGAAPASAAVIIDDTPTILGPAGSVNHDTTSGYGGSLDWVSARGIVNPEVNAARWDVALTPGNYLVEAWIPHEHGYTHARYAITHAGTTSEVRLNQSEYGNVWVTLGTYAFDGSQSSVRSTDAAGMPGEELVWDAIRFTPVSSLPQNVESDATTTVVDDPQVSGPDDDIVRFVGVGYHDDLLRTYAQGSTAMTVNSATWSAPVTAGTYDVSTWIAREHGEAAVSYVVRASGGNVSVPIAQSGYHDVWVPLGQFTFGESGATVTTNDATGVIGQEISWDAMRFTKVATPPNAHQELSDPGSPINPPTTQPLLPQIPDETGQSHQQAVPSTKHVAAQHRDLLRFAPYDVAVSGGGSGRGDAYKLADTRRTSSKIGLTYRCAPCLFLSSHPLIGRTGRPLAKHVTAGVASPACIARRSTRARSSASPPARRAGCRASTRSG